MYPDSPLENAGRFEDGWVQNGERTGEASLENRNQVHSQNLLGIRWATGAMKLEKALLRKEDIFEDS
jgi:hypothetical protein